MWCTTRQYIGTLFFLIFVNDILETKANGVDKAYADYASVYLSGDNLPQMVRKVNEDLSIINKWMVSDRMVINASESKFMVMRGRRKKFEPDHGN